MGRYLIPDEIEKADEQKDYGEKLIVSLMLLPIINMNENPEETEQNNQNADNREENHGD